MEYSMEELLPIVNKLANQYTGFDSTSLTYEKANQLMGAVLYCINEQESDRGELLVVGISAQECYRIGREVVEQKVRTALMLYNQLTNFADYDNVYLRMTMKELGMFFQNYDVKFYPQQDILNLDYPLMDMPQEKTGIDMVLPYVEQLYKEMKFLSQFSENEIRERLDQINPDYTENPVNLYRLFLDGL